MLPWLAGRYTLDNGETVLIEARVRLLAAGTRHGLEPCAVASASVICTTVMVVHSFKTVPVLMTGAGRGIGKRLAIGFATQGARVGLLARSKPELDLCQLEIEHAGGNALRIRADVSDYEQVAASVERMRVHFGSPVQVLVCAAAMQGPIGPFAEINPKIVGRGDPHQFAWAS